MKKFYILIIVLLSVVAINVNATNGWKKIGKNMYYYKNNVKVTGFKTIKNKKYYFNGKGVLQKNKLLKIKNEFYYAQKDGSFAYKWKKIKKKYYYFDPKDGRAFKGYHDISGKTYYFYAGSAALRKGFHKVRDNIFWSDKNGVVRKGWLYKDGKKYYFSKTAPYQALKGYQTINGKFYYFYAGSGVLRTGFHKIRDNIHYSDAEGLVQKGWTTINGKKYYFNENYPYEAYKGYRVVGETEYHFNPNTGELGIGLYKVGDNLYYSDSNGIIQKGWQTVNGKEYYFNLTQPYIAYSGSQRVDGKLYYFDVNTKAKTVGWAGSGTSYYHSSEDGVLDTGLMTIGETKYNFDTNGKLLGFSTNNGKVFYTDPDGKLLKGTVRMCNRYFKFDEVDGHFVKFVNQKSVIDVSYHNGKIDWKKVKYSGEVDAVIVRIGYGFESEDTKFETNITELNKYNIPYSVYFFSYASNENEALTEAKFVVKTLKKYNVKLSGNLPIFYDLEPWTYKENGKTYSSSNISKATYGKIINKFISYVETNYKKKTRLYASRDYITSHFPAAEQKYATWVAAWVSNFNYNGPYEGWQYTSDGSVAGINGRVDMSWFYY